MEFLLQFQRLCHREKRRWLFVVGLVAITHFFCQSLMLPYGTALRSLLPGDELSTQYKGIFLSGSSSVKSIVVRNSVLSNASDSVDTMTVGMVTNVNKHNAGGEISSMENEFNLSINDKENTTEHDQDRNADDDILSEDFVDLKDDYVVDNDLDYISSSEKANGSRHSLSVEKIVEPSAGTSAENISEADTRVMPQTVGAIGTALPKEENNPRHGTDRNADDNFPSKKFVDTGESFTLETDKDFSSVPEKADESRASGIVMLKNISAVMNSTMRKKFRCDMPPKSITPVHEMNQLLARHRRSSRAMRPRWSTVRDQEILAAKLQIGNAPIAKNDGELYAPLFRNVSMFKSSPSSTPEASLSNCKAENTNLEELLFSHISDLRSYELMERTLKVYVYKDGEKPIFHQPILKGLYASEGWFMKLMEGNKQFVVKDPRKAHLFYMPFSSRMLEYTLYVRNSHNRTNLRQYLKQYSESIAAKYRFWNRTGGADHFLVACHDWVGITIHRVIQMVPHFFFFETNGLPGAINPIDGGTKELHLFEAPYETRHHMEHCIKALCNADVTAGFKIGRDVSLPETYVRSAKNPLRDLGGKPPSKRHMLAFYAGNIHGYLRPILLNHWKDKDPDMRIFGPMPPGVASKMNYIQHMKSSKYCICPKGYEVNSPRVVESIFYECIPVIISDNFVPPFFEVLDWSAFSVILAEKDIPKLKDILVSIPQEKYLDMQLAVRKVQKHFLWHAKPLNLGIDSAAFYDAVKDFLHRCSDLFTAKERLEHLESPSSLLTRYTDMLNEYNPPLVKLTPYIERSRMRQTL